MINLSHLPCKSVCVRAVKIGVDGRKQDLGILSYSHANPVLHVAVNAWVAAKALLRRLKEV